MTEEQVFLAILDLAEPADRTAYLEKVCAGDVELRRQVEDLLAAHFKSGAFLDEPLGKQLAAGSATSLNDTTSTSHAVAEADTDTEERKLGEKPDDLPFLQPSTRPDSLGRIGNYEVLQVLGKGGFGIVMRAFDEVLQRVVALKVLAPAIAATSPARKRFSREARSSAKIRHENVVQVHAVVEQPWPYLVMEFVPGETLQQRLDRTGPLEALEIVCLGRQIAEGLAAAHATGLIHRDIKPGNVLLEGEHHRVKLTDFGLARAADDASLTQSGVLAGTPMYMAPEQAKGEALDYRADLFSLGSVLYVLATGRPPFRAGTTFGVLKRVVEDDPRPIRDVIPEMPQWLCEIIAKLQTKRPEDRFQSAREVADILAGCEARLKANAQPKDFPRIPQRKSAASGRARKWKWVAAAALLFPVFAVAMMELAGVTHWFRNPDAPKNDDRDSVRRDRPDDKELPVPFTNTLGMEFKPIPAGKFMMGSSKEEIEHFLTLVSGSMWAEDCVTAEGPEHEVEITRPFYMGATEVTVGQFRQFVTEKNYQMGDDRWQNPGWQQTDDHPVVWVTWNNAVDFCNWLSAKEGRNYRLPMEAEWEYCCRAGKSGTRYFFGDDETQLKNYAWFGNKTERGTHPVGGKIPNRWGLYDMHGNAWEWCQDYHDPNYYKTSPVKDPPGSAGDFAPTCHELRGGSWDHDPVCLRSAFRTGYESTAPAKHIGFRVLLVSPLGGVRTESTK